jgi:hypothetical protein
VSELEGAGLVVPSEACALVFDELPRADPGAAALAIIERARQRLLGDGLLTVNANLSPDATGDAAVELQRVWSSNPVTYPVAGRKRKPLTPWSRRVLREGRVFLGEGDAAIAAAFDDHAVIAGLGLHAIVNTPVLQQGRCVATVNVLGSRAVWTVAERRAIQFIALLAMPSVLELTGRASVAGTAR